MTLKELLLIHSYLAWSSKEAIDIIEREIKLKEFEKNYPKTDVHGRLMNYD